MTTEEKARVFELRKLGCSYREIARQTGTQFNTIKSFCRRHDLGERYSRRIRSAEKNNCPQCGKPLDLCFRTKPRRFCSDACRQAWWNANRDLVNRKAIYEYHCEHCGKPFTAYGNANRKYCCHACYTAARFGKGAPA